MRALLDPTLDVTFKMLFAHERNRNLLISLLSAVLQPTEPIAQVEVLNPEVSKETIRDKGIVLDVRVLLEDGRQVNVEMQSRPERDFRQRGLFYWARLYTSQLQRGEEYQDLAPVISLFILDFVEFPGSSRYHSEFRILDVQGHEHWGDNLILHVLELPQLPAFHEAKRTSDAKSEPLLSKWGRFLKVRDPRELEELAMNDPIFEEAKTALEHLSADPKAQELAEERKIWAWNYKRQLHLAKKEGLAEGEAKGREEGEAKGREEGERLLLQKQLTLRFGPLSGDVVERLDRASEAELSLWAERILSAATLDEVLET